MNACMHCFPRDILYESSADGVERSRRALTLVDVWMLPGRSFGLFRTQNVPDVVHYKVYRHCKHTTTKPCMFHFSFLLYSFIYFFIPQSLSIRPVRLKFLQICLCALVQIIIITGQHPYIDRSRERKRIICSHATRRVIVFSYC